MAVLLACSEAFMPLSYGASQPWLAVVGIALSSAAYHAGRMQPVFTGEGKAAFLSQLAKWIFNKCYSDLWIVVSDELLKELGGFI